MTHDIRLHEAMNAIAQDFPSLSSAEVLAQGVHHRRRSRAAMAASGLAVLALGGALAWTQLPSPADSNGVAPPAATPSAQASPAPAPSESSPAPIISDLAPADRFVKGDRYNDAAAVVTPIVDKALKAGETRELRLIKATDQDSIPPIDPDQPEPARTTISGSEVTIGGNGTLMEANWMHDGVRYLLQWDTLPEYPVISNDNARWLIARSIAGKL